MTDETKPAALAEDRNRDFVNKVMALRDPWAANARKLAREMYPDAPVPSEDAETLVKPLEDRLASTEAQLKSAMEKIAAREKADDDLRVENELSMKLSKARREFNLTDSGYDKMVARMKDTGNYADADAAAAWVMSQTPKPEPTSSPTWLPEPANFFGSRDKDEQWESLHKDPLKFFDDQLREFSKNPDKYVAETFGGNA
jgi:hypothetical protein